MSKIKKRVNEWLFSKFWWQLPEKPLKERLKTWSAYRKETAPTRKKLRRLNRLKKSANSNITQQEKARTNTSYSYIKDRDLSSHIHKHYNYRNKVESDIRDCIEELRKKQLKYGYRKEL